MEARKSNHPNKNKTNKNRQLVISNKKLYFTSHFHPLYCFIQYLIGKLFGLALITKHSGAFKYLMQWHNQIPKHISSYFMSYATLTST